MFTSGRTKVACSGNKVQMAMANGEVAWQMYVLTVDNTYNGIHSSADAQYRYCWWFDDASVYLKEVFNVALFTDMLRIFQLAVDFGKAVFRSCLERILSACCPL